MGAAKHIIQEYDLSGFVPKMSGIMAGIVINSKKGPINSPRLMGTVDQYIQTFGAPNPANGVAEYSAINYLTYGGPIWVTRSAHNTDLGRLPGLDPKYSVALVRTKVDPVPPSNVIPDPSYRADPIVKPLPNGMTQHDIDAYVFDLYKTNRVYGYIDTVLEKPALNEKEIQVFGFEDLQQGQDISLTPTVYVTVPTAINASVITLNDVTYCNPGQFIQILETKYKMTDVDYVANTVTLEFPVDMPLALDFPIYIIPYDLSGNLNIEQLEERVVSYDILTLSKAISADKGSVVRLLTISEVQFSALGAPAVDVTVVSKPTDTSLVLNSVTGILPNHTIKVNGTEFVVLTVDANTMTVTVKVATGTNLIAANGDAVTLMLRTYVSLETPPYVIRTTKGSNQLIVTESDYIKNNTLIAIGNGITTSDTEVSVEVKNIYRETQFIIHTDFPVTAYQNFRIYRMDHSEFEERDGFLVYADNQGTWGNVISVEMTESKYPGAFYLAVYKNGVFTGEKFLVSRAMMQDGFNNQLEIESVINGKSMYIRVKNNVANVDEHGFAQPVLLNNFSVWRQDNEDIFQTLDSGIVTTAEDVVLNDVEIMVSNNLVFALGDRIKFGTFPEEYKVKETRVDVAGNMVLMLDRKIKVDRIPSGTEVIRFHHIKYYPATVLPKAYPGYNIPHNSFVVAGSAGTLLDGGVNNFQGGHNGSAVTIGDLMMTADVLARDTYPFQLILDGGFAYPAYQQKIVTIAEKRMTCFAYLSVPLAAEVSTNYLNDIVAYRNSTMLNTSWASIFSSHVIIYDQWNQMEVVVSPEAFAASQQAYVERNATMWTPAAGWTYGKIKVLGLARKFLEHELDFLVDNQVNPLKYEDGDGISIWGNETMQTMPSYLSMRHVRMLLIVIEFGLKKYMKYQSFKLNDQATRDIIVYNINKFFAEVVVNGIYDFKIVDVTNDSNISNREGVFRMMFSPKTSMEKIVSQVVITSKGMDFSLVNI